MTELVQGGVSRWSGRTARRAGVAAGAGLVVVMVALAWLAQREKCATYDEPLDAMEGWMAWRLGEYRIGSADPPLLYEWAAAFQPPLALKTDLNGANFRDAAKSVISEHEFASQTLYRTPGNDADGFLGRCRARMIVLAALAAVVIGAWGYRLGGVACGVAAMVLFCLDPNIIAHASLVKNDVSMATVGAGIMAAVWAVGRRATWTRVGLLAILCGLVLCVKFSGMLYGPIVLAALALRAMIPQPWRVLGRVRETRTAKLAAAGGMCVACCAAAYAIVWASYGFRFSASRDPSYHLESHLVARRLAQVQWWWGHPEIESPDDVQNPPLGAIPRIALFLQDHRLLPEAFANGMVRNDESNIRRPAFLMGRYGNEGWWDYFPLAFAFKAPLATLAAVLLAPGVFLRKGRRGVDQWGAMCLALPIVIYGAIAMAGHLDIGIRHLFPIYPFIVLAVGLAFARYWQMNRRLALIGGMVLAVGLAAETMSAFPDYIPFFNLAAGGARGGLNLLSDSNLDWGQDLKLLAAWQRKNPETPLYLCYFGTAEPKYYGLHYINLPGSDAMNEDGSPPPIQVTRFPRRGVLAISATALQTTYLPSLRMAYDPFRHQTPIAVLGGSIYLYPVGPAWQSKLTSLQ